METSSSAGQQTGLRDGNRLRLEPDVWSKVQTLLVSGTARVKQPPGPPAGILLPSKAVRESPTWRSHPAFHPRQVWR